MRWRLVLGVIAFAVWAPPSLAGLPCAALLLVAPDRSPRTPLTAAAIGAVSALLLVLPGGGRPGAVRSACTALVTAAFVAGAVSRPVGLLPQAPRAPLAAGAGTAPLGSQVR